MINYQEMPENVAKDLYTRMVALKQGKIEKNEVLANTINWLEANGHEDEVQYYEDFMHMAANQ